jgi:hypothetical protein
MRAGDTLGGGEAESHAARVPAPGRLQPSEGFEHPLQVRLGQSRPVVFHQDQRLLALPGGGHPRRAAIPDGVVDEVGDGAAKADRFTNDGERAVGLERAFKP